MDPTLTGKDIGNDVQISKGQRCNDLEPYSEHKASKWREDLPSHEHAFRDRGTLAWYRPFLAWYSRCLVQTYQVQHLAIFGPETAKTQPTQSQGFPTPPKRKTEMRKETLAQTFLRPNFYSFVYIYYFLFVVHSFAASTYDTCYALLKMTPPPGHGAEVQHGQVRHEK